MAFWIAFQLVALAMGPLLCIAAPIAILNLSEIARVGNPANERMLTYASIASSVLILAALIASIVLLMS